ncbi:MAG: OB-fold domain-containing protein [Acidimicrobiales bacterium]
MSAFPVADPHASGLHAEWYEANRAAGAVTAQRCDGGHWRHPARYRCGECGSTRWTFEPVGPEAVVESWTITRRALHPSFADAVPYGIVFAHTAEGPRFFVHTRPSLGPDDTIGIGEAVTLAVDEFGVPYAELSRSR